MTLSLHDSLSLGQVETALSSSQERSDEEIQRLPSLLRLLQAARPLSSCENDEDDDDFDAVIQEAVDRLEDRAALYSAAEGVEVVACHLSPAICRRISRVQPNDCKEELELIATSPLSNKRRHPKQDGDDEGDSDEEMSDQELAKKEGTPAGTSSRERESFLFASEDSLEATVTKTLSELTLLVLNKSTPLDDSILGEEARSTIGCDLASTVASLLHHAPVLKHRQVAAALCHAKVPQAASLISRMGANCPAAIPALLRGCLDAPNSRKSIIALASLSPRESSRIRTILRRDNLRPDIQLELALKDDVFEAALFLSEQLASTDSPAPPIKSSASDDGNEESESFSLRAHLETNPELVRVVLEKLTAELESGRSNTIIWVRTGILLNSIIRLLQTVSLQQFVKFKDAKGTISKMLIELKEWANLIADQTDAKCFSPLFSALVSFLVVVGEDESVRLDWSSGMDLLFRCKSPVNRALLARFVSAVRNKEVGTFVYDMNGHCLESHLDDWTVHQFEVASQWVPASLSCDLDQVLEQGTKEDALVADPAVGFCVIRTHTEEGASARAARQLLSTMLDSESYASPFLCSDVTPDLIDEAIECSLRGDDTFIPVVLPLEMEKISRDSSFRNRYSLTGKESRFLLCLFYTLSLRDQGGTSHNPFLPDVRELPLQQVYSVLATLSEDGISRSMRMKLKDLIARHCYESVPRSIYCDITRCEVERNSTVRAVLDVIHRSVRDPAWDPSGLLAERAFLWAQSELCPSVLISSTVNALVSDPSNTSRYYSYYGLCRDPVVVLQCPTEIWGRKGLRRVCLSLLSALLEANESIALESAPNDDVRQELIESRNTLVVRCLMKALCDDGRCYGPYCSSTLSLIRKIIAKNRGVFSTLLKQNLCSNELDWLVEWVPEVMEDGYALSSILSERNSLSTAERLVVADGIIRVAIAHGHRFPSETKVLVFSALSQLLSSFFLIVGPVGVPVTTLVGNGEGLDATHVSRKAAFRILKAISKVPSYRVQIRSECVMALQKLGGLCKGESSTGGSRQKNLMKELLDAITRTLGTLGSGIQI